ncbi:hypothetical protein ACFL5O_12120 [Myxococcota bacterium]
MRTYGVRIGSAKVRLQHRWLRTEDRVTSNKQQATSNKQVGWAVAAGPVDSYS